VIDWRYMCRRLMARLNQLAVLWTHRRVHLSPDASLMVPRSWTNARVAAALAAYIQKGKA
jgi:hypothetical protein